MQSTLHATEKSVVAPGQILATGMDYLPGVGTYRHEDKILANQLGLLAFEGKVLTTAPLAGRYLPTKNDVVIGKVLDVLMSGWRIEFNSPYSAVLPLKDATSDFIRKGEDLTEYFDLGDQVVCKITQVTSQNLIDVSMKGPGLRKLRGGQFLNVSAAKVARIIGRRGSMVGMIMASTGCDIAVGQNGVVWISGEPAMEVVVAKAIHMIDRQAHTQGLTERVKEFLESATGRKIDLQAIEREATEREAAANSERRFERREPPRDFRNDGPRPPREESFRKDADDQ